MALSVTGGSVDRQLEKDGVWVEMDAEARVENGKPIGPCIKLASYANPDFTRKLQHLMREKMHIADANGGIFPPQIGEDFENIAASEYLIRDWQEFEKEEGVPFEYSKENALWLLRNNSMVRDAIFRAAKERWRYKKAQLNGDIKNS